MRQTVFSDYRVLLVGPRTDTMRLLRSVLAIAGVGTISHVEGAQGALDLLGIEPFNAVFYDRKVDEILDRTPPKPFIVAARRSESMLNPMVPIFVLQEHARRRDVEKARDNGVTGVLTTPISPKTLIDKLQAVTLTPRPFIVASEFFGPDRRTKARPAHSGSDRRKGVATKIKVDFPAT